MQKLLKRISSGLRSIFRINRLSYEVKNHSEQIGEMQKKIEALYWEMHKVRSVDLPELSMALDPRQEKIKREILKQLVPSNQDKTIKLNRYGKTGDGGYYIAAPIYKTDILFTAGLADDISFEIDLSEKVSRVVSLDHTISQIETSHKNFTHLRKALSVEKSEISMTLADLISQFPSPDYLLKIDIEGDEWKILDGADFDTLTKFRMITIELHNIATNLFQSMDDLMIRVLKKLLISHFVIVSHPNNYGKYRFFGNTQVPDVIEVTYLRRDEIYETYDDQNFQNSWKTVQNSPTDRPITADWIDDLLK